MHTFVEQQRDEIRFLKIGVRKNDGVVEGNTGHLGEVERPAVTLFVKPQEGGVLDLRDVLRPDL
ncbi:MAG: hypothetical protein VX107_10420, partial [Pseudomonadota bacterium]|nr:hypothetical protein [Pseudomonadota bacterium]